MSKMPRNFIKISAVFFIILFFISLILFWLPKSLNRTRRVKANILVIEGWISEDDLKQAVDETKNFKYDLVLTTGGPLPGNFEMLYSGTLIFKDLPVINIRKNDSLLLSAFGTYAGNSNAHFIVFADSQKIGEGIANSSLSRYSFSLPENLHTITDLRVSFDNDYYTSPQDDRNFYVNSIEIGNNIIPAVNDSNIYMTSYFTIPVFTTTAIKAAYYLNQAGVSKNKIIAIPFTQSHEFRTLTAAINLANWIKEEKINITGVQVFSEGIHSRKSWLVYRYALKDKYPIGVIAANGDLTVYNRSSLKRNGFRMIREGIENIYFQFLILIMHLTNK